MVGSIFGQAFKQDGFHREFYALSGKYFRKHKCCVLAGVGALWSGLGLYGLCLFSGKSSMTPISGRDWDVRDHLFYRPFSALFLYVPVNMYSDGCHGVRASPRYGLPDWVGDLLRRSPPPGTG